MQPGSGPVLALLLIEVTPRAALPHTQRPLPLRLSWQQK